MDYKKLFWHRMWLALAILMAWSTIAFTGGITLLIAFMLIGALAGTFFKDLTRAKTKNWRWFTVQGVAFVLAYIAAILIVPFTAGALPKGQTADFIAIANTGLFFGLVALVIFTLGRIGAESYRTFAARTFYKGQN